MRGKWTSVKMDWFQQTSQSNARFCIENCRSNNVLSWLFRVRVDKEPILHPLKMSQQDYYEGLWEYDVAEWFLVNPVTGKYIEFNLAPTGAWWMMAFDAPRQRMDNDRFDLKGIKTTSKICDEAWEASLQIPVLVVEKLVGRDVLKHNVCFILGQNPREYLSWTRLAAKQPDFHRPDDFSYYL